MVRGRTDVHRFHRQLGKEQLCGNYKAQAAEEGVSVYDILNREAEKLPIGSDGIIALDFFQGNGTPYGCGYRGMFYGLSLGHTPAHMCQFHH